MTDALDGIDARPQPTTNHGKLLDQAVERSFVLGRVRRLAIQELRGHPTCSAVAGQVLGSQPARRSEFGFAAAQGYVMMLLADAGSLSVGEIAERGHVTGPTISRILKHLETQGLIERHVDRSNRRVIHVVLTEAGRAAEVELMQRFKAALHHVLSPLTEIQLADLIVAFGHLEGLMVLMDGPDEARRPS